MPRDREDLHRLEPLDKTGTRSRNGVQGIPLQNDYWDRQLKRDELISIRYKINSFRCRQETVVSLGKNDSALRGEIPASVRITLTP